MLNSYEVSQELGISIYTLKNWYIWERKLLAEGAITEPYLPQPIKMVEQKGKPNMWEDNMIPALKEYQKQMVVGCKGVYGKYSNPYHKQTKKYQKEMEEKNDAKNNN